MVLLLDLWHHALQVGARVGVRVGRRSNSCASSHNITIHEIRIVVVIIFVKSETTSCFKGLLLRSLVYEHLALFILFGTQLNLFLWFAALAKHLRRLLQTMRREIVCVLLRSFTSWGTPALFLFCCRQATLAFVSLQRAFV